MKTVKQCTRVTLLIFLVSLQSIAKAQGTYDYAPGLKIKLGGDTNDQRFLRIITFHQFWLRSGSNNPGSTINGEKVSSQTDFSLRRSRLILHAQINPDFLILTTLGANNGNQSSGGIAGDAKKPVFFMHDAWVQHRIYKNILFMGAGLHVWQGPSRLGSASTMNFLGLDAPMFNWQNIESSDQFGRQFGVFVKGKVSDSRLDYRFSVNFPYALNNNKDTNLTRLNLDAAKVGVQIANYKSGGHPNNAFQGYLQYQFFDIEDNTLPFVVGSYLGTKKIFNIGAGFYQQTNAMWSAKLKPDDNSKYDTIKHDQLHISLDLFLDLPFKESNTALTLYTSYNYLYMGPNFVRNMGVNNPASGKVIEDVNNFNGGGNSWPIIGTGNIYFTQVGFLLPKIKNFGRLQPYVSNSVFQFERMGKTLFVSDDLGVNWLLNGQSMKLTFSYRTRPFFEYDKDERYKKSPIFKKNIGEFIAQVQIYL